MILHLEDLRQSLSGVGGALWFECGDICFPDNGWRECVSADFERWIPCIASFAQDHTDVCVLEFMDGPFRVILRRNRDGIIRASFRKFAREVIPEKEIDLLMLLRNVLRCLRTYECAIREWGLAPAFARELAALNHVLKQE